MKTLCFLLKNWTEIHQKLTLCTGKGWSCLVLSEGRRRRRFLAVFSSYSYSWNHMGLKSLPKLTQKLDRNSSKTYIVYWQRLVLFGLV